MTDLATQPQAEATSDDDVVAVDEAVENEASIASEDDAEAAGDESATAEDDSASDAVADEADAVADEAEAPADEDEAPADEDAEIEDEDQAAEDEDQAPAGENVEDEAPADETEAPADEDAEDEDAEIEDEAAEIEDEAAETEAEAEADVEAAEDHSDEAEAEVGVNEDEGAGEPTAEAEDELVEDDAAEEPVVEDDAAVVEDEAAVAEDHAQPDVDGTADDAEAEDEAETDSEADAETDADADADVENDAEAEVETDSEAETETDDADTDTDTDTDETVALTATELAPEATAVVAPATAVLPPAPVFPSPAAPSAPAATATAPAAGSPVFAWAPAEPQPKKKRTALWVSAAAGVAVVGLVVSSLVLIAPGTTVAGVPVGWLTPGAAADAIDQRLAETTVVLTGEGGDVELTGAELGATVDSQALADAALAEHPMWNPTAWFATTGAEVEVDAATATAALRDAAPQLYTEPVDATLGFDAASASYVSTPAEPGTGVDVATVQDALQAAFEAGQTRVQLAPVAAEIPAGISTEVADTTKAQLNGMLDTAGFYVGEERTVPIDRATLAGWLTVAPDAENGAYDITADSAAIQGAVDGLAAAVNRPVENGTQITNSAGKVLREEAPGVSGRELGDTSGMASDFAAQLASGDAVFQAPVTETAPVITTLARSIEVNLSTQTAQLFENGNVVGTYTISSGRDATPTPTGRFTVSAYTRIQDMGALCYNPAAVNSYCTEDVPYITWFAPDIAFHGASAFRSSLGYQQSHGCVNMWDADAKFVYDWTARGTEVWVHK